MTDDGLPDPATLTPTTGLKWRLSGRPVEIRGLLGQDEHTGDVGLCPLCDGRRLEQARRHYAKNPEPEA